MVAMSSALYSEQLKGIFGFNNTGPNAPVRNIRLTRETLEKMEEDQLNATHDQLDLQEEQIKLLKKIARSVANGSGGNNSSLFETLAGGYLGYKGLKGIGVGVGAGASKLKSLVGNIFKTSTSQVLSWTKGISGTITATLSASRTAIRGLRLGMVSRVRAATALLSSTILSTVTGLLNNIGGIIKSGAKAAGKIIAKLAGPIIAGWGAYEGWQQATELDKNNKLSKGDKASIAAGSAVDSLLFGVPSMIQQQRTGETWAQRKARRKIESQEAWEKAGGWTGTWNEFKQAIGMGGDESPAANTFADPSISRNLAIKRRNQPNALMGTILEPISNPVGTAIATVGASAAATAIAETKKENSMFTYTNPVNNKTYSYFEILTKFAGAQYDVLKDIYKVADEQLDKTKEQIRNKLGFSGEFWDNLFKDYSDTSIGDQANKEFRGTDGGTGASSGGDTPAKSFGNQVIATPRITASESLAADLQKFNPNASITSPTSFTEGTSGDHKTGAFRTAKLGGTALSGDNKNAQSWYDFFTKPKEQGGMGYQPHQARGMIATMQGESGDKLDPTSYNPNDRGKPSIGTAQWRGDRATRLKSVAAEMGLPWQDIKVQQEMFKREMGDTHKHVDTALRATTTAEEAVDVGVRKFEVPQHAGAEVRKRTEKLEKLRVVDNKQANINPRMFQPELSGDLSVKLPQYGGNKLDPNAVVKQDQAKLAGIRKGELTDTLQNDIAEHMLRVFGPGYTASVYSGGQNSNRRGEGTGTTRHNKGRAGDIKMFNPEGNMISQEEYARFAQSWLAEKKGGIGLQMRGGGIHVDEHKNRAPFWSYEGKSGGMRLSAQTRDIIERGKLGEKPEYVMTPEQAQAMMTQEGKKLATNMVKLEKTSLKEVSRGYRGLAKLVNGETGGVLDALSKSKPVDLGMKQGGVLDALTKSKPNSSFSGLDIYNNGAISSLTPAQEQLLRMQGTEIAKGMVEAERVTPKRLDFNPQVQSNAIFNAVDSAPVKGSKVSENPTGSSHNTLDIKPNEIPHTDELTMLMANSQMMG